MRNCNRREATEEPPMHAHATPAAAAAEAAEAAEAAAAAAAVCDSAAATRTHYLRLRSPCSCTQRAPRAMLIVALASSQPSLTKRPQTPLNRNCCSRHYHHHLPRHKRHDPHQQPPDHFHLPPQQHQLGRPLKLPHAPAPPPRRARRPAAASRCPTRARASADSVGALIAEGG